MTIIFKKNILTCMFLMFYVFIYVKLNYIILSLALYMYIYTYIMYTKKNMYFYLIRNRYCMFFVLFIDILFKLLFK